ncbi:MAG TPA: molybdenum cofactor biosynthesis protein MoaE [Pirellulales bacterium]|jgi:molybdopterin synthase catalytic subunit|nr:molybdenum cofactor biosynthesis protein MoaE [Pirellulales bacterium]
MIRLNHEPIDPAELCESVRSARAGGTVLFLGTVRELTGSVRTEFLEYEAYQEMAEKMLADLESQARQRWPIVECAIVHRLGRLEPKTVCVAVAVSTPHRADAFEAARWLIDTLKQNVPIWKKEHGDRGAAHWVHPGTC